MAPEEQEQQNGSTEDTSGQEQQGQQQAPTDDTSGNGEQQQQANQEQQSQVVSKDAKLPDDHPVVKQLKADKEKLAKANTELAEARAQAGKVTKLEEDLGKRPTTEAMETLQTRYDRLEEFVLAVGLGKALDSRTFTKDLFESDTDINTLVKQWHRDNPSATSEALGNGPAGETKGGKQDPNALLRAAFNGS